MTDEEIVELGKMTMHGDLPQNTVMRLYFGACRLIDEKRKREERDDPELAAAKSLIKEAAKVIRASTPTDPQIKRMADMAHALEHLRAEAERWKGLYDKALKAVEDGDAKCVSYKREIELLQGEVQGLRQQLKEAAGV